MQSPKVLIIIPTYNERENIASLIHAVFECVNVTILVVDDNSPDGTGTLVHDMARTDERLHILHRPAKAGLGSAYREGFAWGLDHGFDYLIQMDADYSHEPRYISQFIQHMTGSDGVIGSRYVPGGRVVNWPLYRRLISIAGNWYEHLVLHMRDSRYMVLDSTGGFNCWSADLIRRIDITTIQSDGYCFQMELKWRAIQEDALLREVPIRFTDRTRGKSKISKSYAFEALAAPFRLIKKEGNGA